MNLTFLEMDYILYMLPPLFLLIYLIYTDKNPLEKVFDKETLERLIISRGLKRGARNLLFFGALSFFIIALARPVIDNGELEVSGEYFDVVVLIDISNSMKSTDLYPNRLEYAKKRLKDLVDALQKARVGIIGFSESAFLISPLSNDTASVLYLLDNIDSASVSLGGTNIKSALEGALNILKESGQKSIVIFSDGGDGKDFDKEIAYAKENDLRIFTVECASDKGAPIPSKNGEFYKDENGNIAITSQNKAFKTLSLETGGANIEVSYDAKVMREFAKILQSETKRHQEENKKIKDYTELFIYPLCIGVLFLLAALFSLPKKIAKAAPLFLALLLPLDTKAGLLDFLTIQKGKSAYENNDFAQAEESFKNLDIPQALYDAGNAQYKSGKLDNAIESYKNAKSDDTSLEHKRLHNLGNAYYQKGDTDNAIQSYEESLKYEEDEATKHNLELAKKKKEQQKQQQQNQDENDKKDQDKQQQDGEKKEAQQQKGTESKQQNTDNGQPQESDQAKEGAPKEEKLSDIEQQKWERLLQEKKRPTILYELKSSEPKEGSGSKW